MANLGGQSIMLGDETGFGSRESIADFGRVLSQYVDAIVVRARQHETVVELAKYCSCSVINGLTDYAHPAKPGRYCTRSANWPGRSGGKRWRSSATPTTSAEACWKLRIGRHAVRHGHAPRLIASTDAWLKQVQREIPGIDFHVTEDPAEAVQGATAVYTDVWASMGQEEEGAKRRRDFAAYQVNAELMGQAPDAYFMHCLPAHRGEEVTDEVMDGPQSIVVRRRPIACTCRRGSWPGCWAAAKTNV